LVALPCYMTLVLDVKRGGSGFRLARVCDKDDNSMRVLSDEHEDSLLRSQ
jgi:hypothetical protein